MDGKYEAGPLIFSSAIQIPQVGWGMRPATHRVTGAMGTRILSVTLRAYLMAALAGHAEERQETHHGMGQRLVGRTAMAGQQIDQLMQQRTGLRRGEAGVIVVRTPQRRQRWEALSICLNQREDEFLLVPNGLMLAVGVHVKGHGVSSERCVGESEVLILQSIWHLALADKALVAIN